MIDVVVTLEGEETYSIDTNGNEVAVGQSTAVFGTLKSATSAEFMAAGKLGIKPSCTVEIYTAEYSGEKTAVINGKRLTVYRTYVKGDRIELHLSERTGNV